MRPLEVGELDRVSGGYWDPEEEGDVVTVVGNSSGSAAIDYFELLWIQQMLGEESFQDTVTVVAALEPETELVDLDALLEQLAALEAELVEVRAELQRDRDQHADFVDIANSPEGAANSAGAGFELLRLEEDIRRGEAREAELLAGINQIRTTIRATFI